MVGVDYILDMYRTNKILREDVLLLAEIVFPSSLQKTTLIIKQMDELAKMDAEKKGER